MTNTNAPDFTSIISKRENTPFSKEGVLTFTFTDPKLAGFMVSVVADSDNGCLNSRSSRLTTIIARFSRYVLAEVNTHRVFGRNSASSRARSVKATIKGVMEEPFVPLWTINRRGMSGEYASKEAAEKATKMWLAARDAAVAAELSLLIGPEIFAEYGDGSNPASVASHWEEILDRYYADGYNSVGEVSENALSIHKQNANRLIEPFMWHEAIITSSHWGNFLELRDSDLAQPEIRAFAALTRRALEVSKPRNTWIHAPFIPLEELPSEPTDFDTVRPLLLRSANECAQVSYNDKSAATRSTASASKGQELFALKHYSPFEHQAISASAYDEQVIPLSEGQKIVVDEDQLVSNLDWSWVQLRSILAGITK